MAVYRFDTGGIPTCGKSAGVYYRIEMATQTVSSWPLTKPSWASPTALTSPFIVGGIRTGGSEDAGQMAMGDVSFEAQNIDIGSGARIGDILDAIDKDTTDLHVRVAWSSDGVTYVYKFWGVVDWTSYEINYGDFADKDTWMIRFSARDTLYQLQTKKAQDWFADQLTHIDYDYKVVDTGLYLSFVGSSTFGSVTVGAGRYAVGSIIYGETGIDNVLRRLPYTEQDLRWMRISEILQSISDYLGLTTNINGSVAAATVGTTLHTSSYGFNTATGGTTMSYVGIDGLYVLSGIWDSSLSVYKQAGTFFDDNANDSSCPFAFRQDESVLEILKNICISLGMSARIIVDGSNERQLTFVEVGQNVSSASYAIDLTVKGASLTPYVRGIEGCQVTVASGSDVRRGNLSSKSVNVNCIFSSCNNVRVQETWAVAGSLQLGQDVMSALWSTDDASPSGTRGANPGDALTLDSMYSVCVAVPKVETTAAPSTAMIEPYGAYQSSAPFAINAVMYPNPVSPYNCWVEVPGMAVGHLYYSSKQGADDISVYRSKGQMARVKVKPINQYIYFPGDEITLTIAGSSATWKVVSYAEDWRSDTVEFELERYYA